MHAPKFFRSFSYDRRMLPNAYLAELETGVSTLPEARLKTGATIGYPGWGFLYYAALCALEPGRTATILETGTNWGCSTIVLASALKDSEVAGKVHTIEIDAENAARARVNFERAGLADRIELHEGDSKEVLPALLKDLDTISVAFLDGGHTLDLVEAEFEAVVPRLAPQGIVMLDNTYQIAEPHEDQRVNGFLKKLDAAHRGNLINLPFCSWYTPGLAIWQRAPF